MSLKPVIALIGRPNVGKSTLFNQLTKSRQALVADFAGLTRDRQYGDVVFENKSFIAIDTGGIGEADDGSGNIDDYMASQSYTAIHEADSVVFVVDARAGLTPSDEEIAKFLHTLGKPVFLVANKTDGVHDASISEFFAMGFGEPFATAASHGKGVTNLLEALTANMQDASGPAMARHRSHHVTDIRVHRIQVVPIHSRHIAIRPIHYGFQSGKWRKTPHAGRYRRVCPMECPSAKNRDKNPAASTANKVYPARWDVC